MNCDEYIERLHACGVMPFHDVSESMMERMLKAAFVAGQMNVPVSEYAGYGTEIPHPDPIDADNFDQDPK